MSEVKKLPFVITICEPAYTGFDKATILCRQGYQFSPDAAVQVFPDGVVSMVLTIGTPTDAAVAAAEQAKVDALALEEIEFNRRVKEAARIMVEQEKREAKEKEVAALRAEQLKQIAKLEAELSK